MAGLIEDLLAGLPQAYSTLEELLTQSKLGRQHYGPQDSMIASGIAHPVEGVQKAGQWLQDQMLMAGQSPVQPMTDPRGAEAGGLAALNLAGLMQTGGLPGAPKSRGGTLGTILAPGMPDYPESAAAKAAEEMAQGASVKDIWTKYKLYPWKDASGKEVLLGEIPDYNAKLNLPARKDKAPKVLDELLVHPEFFKNNPDLAKTRVEMYNYPYSGEHGYTFHDDAGSAIALNRSYVSPSRQNNAIKTLLHELTHIQQKDNNLPAGTTPSTMRAILNMQKAKEGMAGKPKGYEPRFGEFNTTTDEEAFATYQKAAGEVQARMIENRFNIGKKRTGLGLLAQTSPLDTMANVDRHPIESLLWDYASGTKQASIRGSKIKEVLADLEARGFDTKNPWYHPDFQNYLKDMGHNGLRNWDMLGRGEIDTAIMVDPESIYNIVTKRPTMAQYKKNKIPAKVIKLVNKYKKD